tara:strand:+ start:1391 stop:1792 length:402 start_codon:yes stop_codon:yes gene_type:complete
LTSKDKKLFNLLAPVSLGELIDKITILEIKKDHMTGIKLNNVNRELELLQSILQDKNVAVDSDLISSLRIVNLRLWDIEDRIRIKEQRQEFDEEFIEIARSVYKENDIRSSIKKDINRKFNSELVEEKSYKYL